MADDITTRIRDAVDDFCSKIGYDKSTIKIEGPLFPYDDVHGAYPLADEPGCYVFADKSGTIHYVGVGTNCMGTRIWAPIGRFNRDAGAEPYPNAADWFKQHKPGVWAAAVPRDHWWLALALEGYLIQRLNPQQNKNLKRVRPPLSDSTG